jgi:two-component system NtrC family response regulator
MRSEDATFMNEETVKNPDVRLELLRQIDRAVTGGDIAGATRLAEKARALMVDRQDPVAGRFRCLEAKLFYRTGDYQKALASSRIAAALLAPYGETEDLAEAFLQTGKALVGLGNYKEAETAYLDAESLYRRNESIAGRINSANRLAEVYFIRAEYRNALKYLLEAVKLAEREGDRKKLAFLWGNLGRIYTFLGNFKKAMESLETNIEISREVGDEHEMAKALLSLGNVELMSEMYEKAEKRFDEAYLLVTRHKMRRNIVICQTFYGELKLRCGDYAAARRFLNDAVDGARILGPESTLMVSPLRALAELELAENKLTAASRLANQALALAGRIGDIMEKGLALRVLARIAAADPDRRHADEKAVACFNQALDVFGEIDARFERAETLVMMAACGLGSARRRVINLFRAADTYKSLGIESKYETAQKLINRVELPSESPATTPSADKGGEPVIITTNAMLRGILDHLAAAARSGLPILLIGETGTGKDLLARYYHAKSGRTGEFVAINCAAFPDTLLESELFGYRKGAFTGAYADKQGLLRGANGGTFFLDEVGDLSLVSQAKLLTVIETCRTRALGDTAETVLDIRFVAATNADLADRVAKGTFRRDLYYRLSGITFEIPSLLDRPEDVPLLLRHFLIKEKVIGENESVDPALVAEFTSRVWPGNVRQLESEVRKLALLSTMANKGALGELAGVFVQNDRHPQTTSLFNQVEQFERSLILKALRTANWNQSQAARSLAIHESTLRAKMKRYHLNEALVS